MSIEGKKWFELTPEGKIQEAIWRMGSMFMSFDKQTGTETSYNFIVEKKPKHRYTFATTEKHARRKFHRCKFI